MQKDIHLTYVSHESVSDTQNKIDLFEIIFSRLIVLLWIALILFKIFLISIALLDVFKDTTYLFYNQINDHLVTLSWRCDTSLRTVTLEIAGEI